MILPSKISPHLEVSCLEIERGQFGIKKEQRYFSQYTGVDSLSLHLHHVVIDKDPATYADRFLFADEAAVNVKTFRSSTSNGALNCKIKNVGFTSRDSVIIIDNIKYHKSGQIDFNLPQLRIEEVGWKHYWNEGELNIDHLLLYNPYVSFIKGNSDLEETSRKTLAEIVSTFSTGLNIHKLSIVNGSFRNRGIATTQGIKDMRANSINLVVKDVHLETDMSRRRSQAELFSGIEDISLRNYEIHLRGSNMSMKAKKVETSS